MKKTKNTACPFGFGVIILTIGIIILTVRLQDTVMNMMLRKVLSLVDGSPNYKQWLDVDLEFKFYLFHVTNPNEVQGNGDTAILVEYGPYVYDCHIKRIVLSVNESADTIEYVARRFLVFNATKSGNYSEDDELTILNIAYIGTITKIAEMVPAFVGTIGRNIPLLFPDKNSIFIRGKAKDILFDGLPLVCDQETYPELSMICNNLETQKPPTVRTISEDGIYAFSYFYKMNGTDDGPYTISRGLQDRFTTGQVLKFKGENFANCWYAENCSVIRGSDSIYYSPMSSRAPEIFIFASDLCRSLFIDYNGDKVYNGVLGYHYKTSKDLWNGSDSSCYCPKASDGTMMCPTQGSLVLDKCQKAPVIMTEPHFLHGSSGLSSIVQGLNPDEDKHAAYVVIEPLSGIPLSGHRKMQLNVMLKPLPVDLLANVSQGLFPLVWADEGLTPTQKRLEPIILIHRFNRLLGLSTWIPFCLGIILLLYSYWMKTLRKTGNQQSGRTIILAPKNTPN